MEASRASETVGDRIRRLRIERQLSQRELSGRGVSAGYISRVERGERTPSMKALRTIAPKLGVSTEYLETGSELSETAQRELRLADAELALRLEDEPTAAEATLRALLTEALETGDHACALRARVALGFAASQRGEHRDVVALLEQAIDDPLLSPATHPEVYATLARAYVAVALADRAVDLLEQCLDRLRVEHPDDTGAYVRFAAYLSSALSDLGDLPGARAVLDEALNEVDGTIDPYSLVRLHWSRARLAVWEGRHANAQANLRQAIALLSLTEDSLHLGRAHLLYAESTLDEERLEETASRLAKAQELFAGRAELPDQLMLLVLRALLLVRTQDLAGAALVAGEALERAGDDDPELRGRAEAALSEALWRQGDLEQALVHLGRAEPLLSAGSVRYLLPFLQLWSTVLEEAGRLPEALAVSKRALALAAESQVFEKRSLRSRARSSTR